MTDTVESEIVDALSEHLSTLDSVWPIAYENVKFDGKKNKKYLRTQDIPGPVNAVSIDNSDFQYIGIFQVTVVTAQNVGAVDARAEAARIIRWFDRYTRITTPSGDILITDRPFMIGGQLGDHTYELPISIPYELITP